MKRARLAVALAAWALAACSPHYNWRESSDNGAHFVVLVPAKPATATRSVDLDGLQADMSMTAAEVDGVVYAVGTTALADAAQGEAALNAMRRALLANIDARKQAQAALAGSTAVFSRHVDIDARGTVRGQATRMVARLGQRGRRLYQVMVMGPASQIGEEQLETFFASFKPT